MICSIGQFQGTPKIWGIFTIGILKVQGRELDLEFPKATDNCIFPENAHIMDVISL